MPSETIDCEQESVVSSFHKSLLFVEVHGRSQELILCRENAWNEEVSQDTFLAVRLGE